MSPDDAYSAVADAQLDQFEEGPEAELYDAIIDACELVFRFPGKARSLSTAISTVEGILFRLPVAGHPPYKMFWSSEGPRIEAVFPHP